MIRADRHTLFGQAGERHVEEARAEPPAEVGGLDRDVQGLRGERSRLRDGRVEEVLVPALERVDAVGRGTVPVPNDTGMPTTGRGDLAPTCRLIARKDKGEIEIDTQTKLCGVPPEAWEYRLGTYSALEWILERYKEKKPKDPTIAEKVQQWLKPTP